RGWPMLLSGLLRKFVTAGTLTLIDASGRSHVVQGNEPGPTVTLRIHDKALPRQLLINPKLRFGEAYMDGRITIEEGTLYEVLEILCRGLGALEDTPAEMRRNRMIRWARHILSFNPVGQ